jgi:deoxyhypusine synthase
MNARVLKLKNALTSDLNPWIKAVILPLIFVVVGFLFNEIYDMKNSFSDRFVMASTYEKDCETRDKELDRIYIVQEKQTEEIKEEVKDNTKQLAEVKQEVNDSKFEMLKAIQETKEALLQYMLENNNQ